MAYNHELLLALRSAGRSTLITAATKQLIASLGFTRRGCRAGKHVRLRDRGYKQHQQHSEFVSSTIPIIVGLLLPRRHVAVRA